MAGASPYGRGLTGLLKQGWHEIPGVMGSSVLAIVGLVFSGLAAYKYATDERKRFTKYKLDYIVYRPDDPRAKKIMEFKEKGIY